jgi:hypothetical protein
MSRACVCGASRVACWVLRVVLCFACCVVCYVLRVACCVRVACCLRVACCVLCCGLRVGVNVCVARFMWHLSNLPFA